MKQVIIIMLTYLCVALAAAAQSATDIRQLFADFASTDGTTTETIISGDALKGTHLSLYRSLVITGPVSNADTIAARVVKCAANAQSREITYVNGKIYYAQFALGPMPGETDNRYLFYLNSGLKGKKRLMIIYMSGKATLNQIKKLINQ
ncbi:MAG: hypothetical protein K2J09_04065 [Muribaculaceae bacterium]|nr:hypothetical protein [Muribaculaceae bacterium]